ncbi:PREDICTED: zinc finger protein 385A-like isoform X3 [Ipomoea nil]|nr:PREDICTED: zinc finger protein 385A-like isoform X3 [Ipomoea nil]
MVSHKSWNSLKILMVFEMILQPSHRGRGRRGGQIFRGAGRGRRGQAPQPPAPVWPPRMAWCELCRVECNTPEILEQHKNGKKHKKNVKVQEELQRVMAAGHNVQPTSSQVQAEVAYQPKATEGSEVPPEGNLSIETVNGRSEQQPQENLPSQALGEENKAEPELPKAESTRDPGESQGRGPKRKTSGGPGGRGGKKLRSHDGRRKPAEPPKPKQIPLICELCNVTCESQVVFQSHLQGKKHISNRKRFEDSQAVLGQAATQALYPALQPVYPALPQPNPGLATPLDPNLQQQNIPGGQAFLTQPAPSLLPQGQEASAAALPPPMLQSLDHQDPSPQFQSQ